MRRQPKRAEVLGILVDRCTPVEFSIFLGRAIAGSRAQRVVTLNPEMVVAARQQPRFANILKTADLLPIDGVGIALALWVTQGIRVARLSGITMLPLMCEYASRNGIPVAFLLRDDGLTTPPLLRAALKERWPELNVAIGTVSAREACDDALAHAVNDHAPGFLIMNMGGTAQEEWITRHADRFPSVRVVVGLGGALDYLCGVVENPPPFVRRFGFEWLWRFVRQPWRARRIANAVIIFPLAVIGNCLRRVRIPRVLVRLRFT